MTGFCESLRDTPPLHRRLKAKSPAFAKTAESFGAQFFADLRQWVASRVTATDDVTAPLQLILALAAANTAYEPWLADESFDGFLHRLERCLRQAGPGTPTG